MKTSGQLAIFSFNAISAISVCVWGGGGGGGGCTYLYNLTVKHIPTKESLLIGVETRQFSFLHLLPTQHQNPGLAKSRVRKIMPRVLCKNYHLKPYFLVFSLYLENKS